MIMVVIKKTFIIMIVFVYVIYYSIKENMMYQNSIERFKYITKFKFNYIYIYIYKTIAY